MAGPFDTRREFRQQQLKEPVEQPSSAPAAGEKGDVLELAAKKRTKQTYTVYLDRELMARVQRLAKQRGVAASAVIEACIKNTLEQLEG